MKENHHDQTVYFRRNQRKILTGFALFFSLLVMCACRQNAPVAETNKGRAQPSVSPSVSPVAQNAAQEAQFKGVRVRNYISRVSMIKPVEKEASPLENADYKPDGVRPRHVSLKFTGDYAEDIQPDSYLNEINVYPVDEFRQAFAVRKDLMESFDDEIKTLRKIISQDSPQTTAKQFPFLLFFEYSPAITVHPKNISFKNGGGTSYITQFDIEPSSIDSENLTYVFQGLTNDGKYYISAFFPVKARNLNEKDLRQKFAALKLPVVVTNDRDFARFKNYRLSVQKLLDKQKAEDFEPNLNEIEKTISSLEVNWREGD